VRRAGAPGGENRTNIMQNAKSQDSAGDTADMAGAGGSRPDRDAADRRWLAQAIELSALCPPSPSAYSVGAVLVSSAGQVIATGYSREGDPAGHAEEIALAKAARADRGGSRLAEATLYSSLEPCLRRASRPRPCAELILAAGIRRVVLAWLEPPLFVPGGGAAWLRAAGVTVIEIPGLAAAARAVNAHLLPG
jgi:diaminohydroxyphosphoribosylaminopyrimidine deaminase/5-amino-6-(5-phosphoribosylamino)uracil reductase